MISNFDIDVKSIKSKINKIGDGLIKSNELVLEALSDCNHKLFEEAKSNIKNVGKQINEIDNDIIKVLALFAPEAKDLRHVIAYLKITNEILRATANTRSFIKGFTDVCSDVDIKMINEYAIPMQKSTVKAITTAILMLNIDCVDELHDLANEVLIEENKTDDLYEMIEKKLVKQADQSVDFEKFHNMLRALRRSEKIADRATSIANLLLYAKIGGTLVQ